MRENISLLPVISIIIPTHNSGTIIKKCLDGVKKQNYPEDKIEIIIADNNSTDDTIKIAESYGAKILLIDGLPPQVCIQRNEGAEKALGQYIYMLDHDMEMSVNLLRKFGEKILETKGGVDGWYIPEKIIGNNKIWSKIRTFERSFYNGTIIDAVRIIKKEKFNVCKYDPNLSSGPADWDFDIQLKKTNSCLKILDGDEYVNHYEKYENLGRYLYKKNDYLEDSKKYQEKWKKLDKVIYNQIVKNQYSAFYRLVGVFIENKKWKKAIKKPHLFIAIFFVKCLIGLIYLLNKKKL